eukprot:6485739-Amphidinium_carterae.1
MCNRWRRRCSFLFSSRCPNLQWIVKMCILFLAQMTNSFPSTFSFLCDGMILWTSWKDPSLELNLAAQNSLATGV